MLLLISNVRHFRGLSGFIPAVQKMSYALFLKEAAFAKQDWANHFTFVAVRSYSQP
jgi:hypothetical protein